MFPHRVPFFRKLVQGIPASTRRGWWHRGHSIMIVITPLFRDSTTRPAARCLSSFMLFDTEWPGQGRAGNEFRDVFCELALSRSNSLALTQAHVEGAAVRKVKRIRSFGRKSLGEKKGGGAQEKRQSVD